MKFIKKSLAALLIVSTTHVGFIQTAQATMIGTEEVARVAQDEARRTGDEARARLQDLFTRADVQARLQDLGVEAADARDRVAALTDEDATRLAEQIDKAPAGGIIGAILLVFFVLLFTDILGFTKVFPFTRSIR
ncbi:PA2779 family protein [Zoogloea sp.]|uniref:PA2779 family protein n=1 Tax=Zoogloea sp. TaxID=49181 RepID=UPI0026239CDC|nr:PA2779 family protein [Zoogloea sp.]MDD3353704.1 PA2779 family protein [Zoogloea sp.]